MILEAASTSSISSLLTAYGAMLVAFIAGAFSVLGLVVSKENKVSEFRHEWINALRDDIAEFMAQNNEQYVELVEYANDRVSYQVYLEHTKESRTALNRASTRIKLRLNQDEEPNLRLMQSMAAMRNFFPDDGVPNKSLTTGQQFSVLSVLAEKEAAKVLAREWDRVKKGERGFRYAKALAYLALALSLAGVVWLTTMAGHLTIH